MTAADTIIDAVERYYRMRPGELSTRTRRRKYAWPRQMAMWMLRNRTSLSYPQIARKLGLQDHTTVMHGVRAFAERRKEYPAEWREMGEILLRIAA